MTSPVPRRLMTPEEQRMAIALGRCRFTPACFDKRFARELSARAESDSPVITDKQADLLRIKVYRYRRQIPQDVVDLAATLGPDALASAAPVVAPAHERLL